MSTNEVDPHQRALEDLGRAIRTYYEVVDPGAFIDDWTLVTHKETVDLTAVNQSAVSLVNPQGQPYHRGIGLLSVALNYSLNG